VNFLTDKNGKEFWIGANDIEIEDYWVWESDTSKLLFSDWDVGEPNNNNNEDCGKMTWHNILYRWNDVPCQLHFHYICEK
jgi:C-type mannose receptor